MSFSTKAVIRLPKLFISLSVLSVVLVTACGTDQVEPISSTESTNQATKSAQSPPTKEVRSLDAAVRPCESCLSDSENFESDVETNNMAEPDLGMPGAEEAYSRADKFNSLVHDEASGDVYVSSDMNGLSNNQQVRSEALISEVNNLIEYGISDSASQWNVESDSKSIKALRDISAVVDEEDRLSQHDSD